MAGDRTSGKSYPLGATLLDGGVNFSVFSKSALQVELLLFDDADAPRPSRVIELHRGGNRTFHYWHVFVPGLRPGQVYAYRARRSGAERDEKVLLDPYGRAVAVGKRYDRQAAARPGDSTACAMKSVVVDTSTYDWENDAPLRRPFKHTVIYEMHVGGFTKHPSSGLPADRRGTYLGLIEKIPYLVDLGVTAVELMPVFQFDEQDAPPGLTNYWGYAPVSFFAPHTGYATQRDPLRALDEFRDMVKALHRAGLEVILDVVYNHTAEGDETGPTFCFKGLENSIYYTVVDGRYANYSGTGNTLNANQSQVRRLILDSLRYWVAEMHVDGFRFDLASILARGVDGTPLATPPILWDIETDPYLAGTKIVAEAWDAAGLYQVGSFIGDRWREWNGHFRDDVRAFVRGDPGFVPKLASRLLASPDIYLHDNREAEQSVNFVTCHDGFTMNDLVSYNEKRNDANGEDNRDGTNHNVSWNCGAEGPTDVPEIEQLRLRQIKNLYTITLLSLGVPMLLMGDEIRRTQYGNNNAYCQDNETSWFDWSEVEKNRSLLRFVSELVHFRRQLGVFRDDHEMALEEFLEHAPVRWHGVGFERPDWSIPSRSLALSIRGSRGLFYVVFNAYWEALDFELPPDEGDWRRVIDTFQPSPHDCCRPADAPRVTGPTVRVEPRSVVLLVAYHRS